MALSRIILRWTAASARSLTVNAPLQQFSFKFKRMNLLPERNFSSEISVPIVNFNEFEHHRISGGAKLIDVRNPSELMQEGAVPGSINIPLPRLAEAFAMDEETFEETFNAKKPCKDGLVIVYCKMGVRSETAGKQLITNFGFTNVHNYQGSFDEWKSRQ